MYVIASFSLFVFINYQRTNKENDILSDFLNDKRNGIFFNEMEFFTKWSHKTFIYIKSVFLLVLFSLIIRDSQGK